MPIVSIRQLHFPIELSESDFSLFHLVNQVFQIISKDDTEVGTLSKCNKPIKNFKPDILILFDCLRKHSLRPEGAENIPFGSQVSDLCF